MAARRNALGRGLGALIPGATNEPSPAAPGPDARAGQVPAGPREIAIDAIDPNPDQPRRFFDPEQLEELAASIRRHGVLQPVVVRPAGDRFELLVGERRWRASRLAGRETIPAVVADVDPGERLELAIVENVQRHDLNPIELAAAYRALADAGCTQEEIGERVGKDRSSVANHLRLLDLSRELQEDVEAGRLSMGHAKALLQVGNPERRRHLRDRIVEGGLSVRDAERLARDLAGATRKRNASPRAAAPEVEPELAAVVERLQSRFQTRVRLQGTGERGRLEIEYFGREDLERVTRLLLEGAG